MCTRTKNPSNSFFKYKDFICITSTDIQGGETNTKAGGRKTTRKSVDDAPPANTTKIKNPPTDSKTIVDNPTYLSMKTMKKSENREAAMEYLTYANIIFYIEDITETFITCTDHYDGLDNPKPKAEEKGKVDEQAITKIQTLKITHTSKVSLNTMV